MSILSMRRRAVQSGSPAITYLILEKDNKPVYKVCVDNGLCGAEGMTYEEAAAITNIRDYFQRNNSITHFEELQYFGITSIAVYAFWQDTNLEVIKLPNSVTSIGNRAFAQCGSLLYIDIPSSVTSISAGAFLYGSSNNGSMQYIKCMPTTPPSILASGTNKILDGTNNCPVYVPDSSVAAYKTAWSDVASRIYPISEFVQP